MYVEALADASFLFQLVEIDRCFANELKARRCPPCGGPLHVANYPRKARGIETCPEAFAQRFSLCCGRCRKRCMPPSVRFLGRRVYVGLIVMLGAMRVLFGGACRRTLRRWTAWWTQDLPKTRWWLNIQGLAPTAKSDRLPASLLEQLEAKPQDQTRPALLKALELLKPLTSGSWCTDIEGLGETITLTQNMPIARNRRDQLEGQRRQ